MAVRARGCEPDGDDWYRSGGGCHEYAVVHGDRLLRLNAPEDELRAWALHTPPIQHPASRR